MRRPAVLHSDRDPVERDSDKLVRERLVGVVSAQGLKEVVGAGTLCRFRSRSFLLDTRFIECYFWCRLLLLQHTRMRKDKHQALSRRERQIMDILYRAGRASASEIHQALPDAPTYSAVRAKLRVLEEKGHVRHEEESLRYVYVPTMPRETARRSALRHVVSTFFEGSVEQAVAALLDLSAANLSAADLERIQSRIDQAKKESNR